MKRFFAILLVLGMVLCMLPVGAGADLLYNGEVIISNDKIRWAGYVFAGDTFTVTDDDNQVILFVYGDYTTSENNRKFTVPSDYGYVVQIDRQNDDYAYAFKLTEYPLIKIEFSYNSDIVSGTPSARQFGSCSLISVEPVEGYKLDSWSEKNGKGRFESGTYGLIFNPPNGYTANDTFILIPNIVENGHNWALDTTQGDGGWEWAADGSSATAHLKCTRDDCGETTTVTDNSPQAGEASYNSEEDRAEIPYTATVSVTEDGPTFTGQTTIFRNITDRSYDVHFYDHNGIDKAIGTWGSFDSIYKRLDAIYSILPKMINCHYEFIDWNPPVFNRYDLRIRSASVIWLKYVYDATPLYQVAGLIHVPQVPATCGSDGAEEYWTCETCGMKYSDEKGENEIDAPEVIPATGAHTLTATAAKDATCTEAGNTAYWTCSVCGKYFSDAEGKTEIEKDSWIIKAKGHTEVKDPAVAATTEKTGLTEGSHCSVCGEIIKKQEVVDKLPKPEEPEAEETEAPHVHTEVVDEAVDPTCAANGLTEGSHCSDCDEVIIAQKTIPALGHWLGSWIPDDAGHHTAKCQRPGCGYEDTFACSLVELPQEDPEAEPVHFCPICGYCDGAEDGVRVEGLAVLEGEAKGNLCAFTVEPDGEHKYLVIAFENYGKLEMQEGEIIFAVPEELSEAGFVQVDEDGLVTLTIDFTPEEELPILFMILDV